MQIIMPRPPPVDQDLITVRMNDTNFTAVKPLLANSSFYFAGIFDPVKHTQPSDGVYRVYGNDKFFHHILQYCHSHKYPLLFSNKDGFDENGYAEIMLLSISFGVKDLTTWIVENKYRDLVKMQMNIEDVRFDSNFPNQTSNADQTLDIRHFQWTKRVYKCPRNINVHRGHPEYCGAQCQQAMPESGPLYEPEEKLGLVFIKKSFSIDYEALMPVMMSLHEEGWPVGEDYMHVTPPS